MSLKEVNSKLQAQRGFTIVELLIVIVVIGILAAITIVAYNGVTARANTTANAAAASTVIKKVEAFNADRGRYPTGPSQLTTGATGTVFELTGVTFDATAFSTSNLPTNSNEVNYSKCGHAGVTTAPANAAAITVDTGVRAASWNYQTNALSYVDSGTVSGTVTTFNVACFIVTT